MRSKTIIIEGLIGVGKSTLVKILDRRYRVHEGELLIDDAAVDSIDLASYRRHVATLPEAVSIINGTIAENILLGRQVTDARELLERIDALVPPA